MTREEAFNTLRRLRDEMDAGRFALARALTSWNNDPQFLSAAIFGGITDTELRRCAKNFEVTYVLRLFAEFEAILRHYWASGLHKKSRPDMHPLMDSIAKRRGMNVDDLSGADDVRKYRNDIIHESLRNARLSFSECLSALGRYLRWLPLMW